MEHSISNFHDFPDTYIHRGKQIFDSGISMDMLQEYIYISLDIFKDLIDCPQNELEAWLAFLAADTIHQVDAVIEKFPYFKNLKDDVILYGEHNPKEVLDLYLEGIEILDQNTYLTEIRQNREKLKQNEKELCDLKTMLAEKDSTLAAKDSALAAKEAEIAKLKALLENK